MTAADFIFPCGFLIFIFMMGFFCCSWYFKRRYIAPLEWRVRRLEHLLREPRTTEPVQQRPRKQLLPRTRYIPLDQR